MPPKKRTVVLSEMPAASKALLPSKVARKSGSVTLRRISMHPGTSVMVVEALKELDSRKGVTKQAIQNFIKRKYPSVDNIRLKYFVGRALKKGLENGTLVHPANSPVTTSIIGRFRLAPKRKESKAKAENVEPNVQKASEEAPKTKAGGMKRAAADEVKSPKKKAAKGPSESKKDEEASPSKAAPAKKPKAKKAVTADVEAKVNVRSKAKSKEAAAAEKTKAKPKDVEAAEKTKAKPKDVEAAEKTKAKPKDVEAAEKTKAKPKDVEAAEKTKAKAKGAKGKAAKDSDKETAPKAAAKRGRKKNVE
ncbi:linker histone H1M isoform X1 [Vanacampus margaritifer]